MGEGGGGGISAVTAGPMVTAAVVKFSEYGDTKTLFRYRGLGQPADAVYASNSVQSILNVQA